MDSWSRLLPDLAIILILIVGIKQFRTPKGARSGNITAAFALLCALGVVLYRDPVLEPAIVVFIFVFGSTVGWIAASRVNMVQIPAMVAFQHGAGGVAAFLVSLVELTRDGTVLTSVGKLAGVLGMVIGAATFSGSMVASGKLANWLSQRPRSLPKHNWLLSGLTVIVVAVGIIAESSGGRTLWYSLLTLIVFSILLGILFAIRIGGADMPVLISFLNATAGLAAAFCGIVIQNRLLIACGATVAASGSILTHVMCEAMNRKLGRVFVGIQLSPVAAAVAVLENDTRHEVQPAPLPAAEEPETRERSDCFRRALRVVKNAKKVVIVPGYGMAQAHAQFETVQLANRLSKMGKEVKSAIHPVAGRMPGHMHVLLAEAEVDPDMLIEIDEANAEFKNTDLALIIGACDVVNPAAINNEGTPISGMPILMVHEARSVVVCNLDALPGYSGVENPLYTAPHTILLLGEAKVTLTLLLDGLTKDT